MPPLAVSAGFGPIVLALVGVVPRGGRLWPKKDEPGPGRVRLETSRPGYRLPGTA